MTQDRDRVCGNCSVSEETAALERCKMCYRFFCSDCAHRGMGQRFCSERCAAEFMFGDTGDDDRDVDDGG